MPVSSNIEGSAAELFGDAEGDIGKGDESIDCAWAGEGDGDGMDGEADLAANGADALGPLLNDDCPHALSRHNIER